MSRPLENTIPVHQYTGLDLETETGVLSNEIQLPSLVRDIDNSNYFVIPGYAVGKPDQATVTIPYAEVQKQVAAAPSLRSSRQANRKYPEPFANHERLALDIKMPWVSYPIKVEGDQTPPPGAVRAVYNEKDRSLCCLMFHDKMSKIWKSSLKYAPFSLATKVFNAAPKGSQASRAGGSSGRTPAPKSP